MHSPHPLIVSDDDPSSPDTITPDHDFRRGPQNFLPGSFNGPHVPSSRTSRQQDFDLPVRLPQPQQTRRFVTPTPAPYYASQHGLAPPPMPFNRPPSRGPPSISTTLDMASGVTSRRPMTSYVPIPRRPVPRQQIDQENSDDVERQAAMAERVAVEMRHGASQETEEGREVMDETPPRIGRFERHIG
jgi:hypothetical protein